VSKVKLLPLLLVTVPVLGSVIATLFFLFLLTFPWENSEPTPGGIVVAVVGGATVGLVLPAAVCWCGIAIGRARLAKIAFAIHALVALGLLGYGLSVSDHSDGTIFGVVFGVEICGLLGVAAASQEDTGLVRG
jgi:hypothetical protein